MMRFTGWREDSWTKVLVPWQNMVGKEMAITDWLKRTEGDRFFYDGWKEEEGVTFMFENPRDATIFKLKWA